MFLGIKQCRCSTPKVVAGLGSRWINGEDASGPNWTHLIQLNRVTAVPATVGKDRTRHSIPSRTSPNKGSTKTACKTQHEARSKHEAARNEEKRRKGKRRKAREREAEQPIDTCISPWHRYDILKAWRDPEPRNAIASNKSNSDARGGKTVQYSLALDSPG